MVSNGPKENLKGNVGGKAKPISLLCPEELRPFLGARGDVWPPQRDQLMVQSHKGNFYIKPEANSLSQHLLCHGTALAAGEAQQHLSSWILISWANEAALLLVLG